MDETLISFALFILGIIAPFAMAIMLAVRRTPATRAFGILAALAIGDAVLFGLVEWTIADWVNGSGGSSVWNGEAALGFFLAIFILGVWGMLCAVVAAIMMATRKSDAPASIFGHDVQR
jgi:hypothetical protein